MTTFTPPVEPSYGSPKTVEFSFKEAQFGDGYRQRAGDGINTESQNWDLRWNNISNADADTIETFLKARAGTEAFEWTTPYSEVKNFFASSFRRTPNGFGTSNLSVTFEESHNN